MSVNHQLPEWFLNHNITLTANLDEIHPKIETVNTTGAKDIKPLNKAGNDQDEKQHRGPTKCQVSSDTFSMLRDILASAFARNSKGRLDPKQSFVILEGGPKTAPIDFLDELVKALAKEIGTSLISYDYEDLEDLALEFSLQSPASPSESKPDKRMDKKMDWDTPMAKHWFSSSSEFDTDAKKEAWERTQRSYSTILDAVSNNQAAGVPEDGDVTETTRVEQPDSTGLVLVHVREAATMLALGNGYRFLGRLCDCIQQRREKGQTIAVVLTIPAQNVLDCLCQQCVDGDHLNLKPVYNNTCATMLSNHFVNPINVGPINFKHTDYMASVNIRRLKRILRQAMSHVFDPKILHPHADWKQLVCKEPGQCFGDEQWIWEKIYGAFLQLNGRSFGKEKLEATDILLVLSRLGLHKHEKPVKKINPAPPEDVGGDLDNEEPVKDKKQTWKDKMTALRQECNPVEQNLVDCVINPVLHLVSSAYLTPSTPSTSLLSQARIKGILLYGPPGTGKTHLTRSIAKESGASMLCVDGASLLSKYVGEIEKNIKAAFTLASKLYPCVLFIDEVDSLFYDRGMARRTWERGTVTQFLSQMDGLAQNDKAPCVIVATNRPDTLDKAFLRRLPQKIPIGLPDTKLRSKILGVLLEGEELEPLVEIDSLARETEGYSGSDLRSLCAEAALIWAIEHIREGHENISSGESDKMRLGLIHFAKALQRIRPSVSKKDLLELESFMKRFNPHSVV
ncbi:ATPase family AAA domain-containing protein 1-A [Fusarium solani]|uniref:ATPase family AAA domain-containing protein 1-A n=1 Tax=Fusarium solani TaxID=169388 RepID=A0A9P9FXR0_FUSSL|nr:ATPase family AAA domain-containing protein 1-A [Fusarium solani]KAH7228412.1 ATPase family AAA domain-containing protein 1-A [Fusarium solani]